MTPMKARRFAAFLRELANEDIGSSGSRILTTVDFFLRDWADEQDAKKREAMLYRQIPRGIEDGLEEAARRAAEKKRPTVTHDEILGEMTSLAAGALEVVIALYAVAPSKNLEAAGDRLNAQLRRMKVWCGIEADHAPEEKTGKKAKKKPK